MAIASGTYYITVDTVGGLPRFATDNGVGKEITVKGGDPAPSPRQKVRIVTLLHLLFRD